MNARSRPSASHRCIVILRGRGEAGGNATDTLKEPLKDKTIPSWFLNSSVSGRGVARCIWRDTSILRLWVEVVEQV